MTKIQFFQSYHVGSEIKLTEQHQLQLVSCFEKPGENPDGILSGRAAVSTIQLKDIGPAIVKNYTRGGVIRNFNRNTYLKFSRYRCQSEYELLLFLDRLGVSVPQPIAFAYRGRFFYHAWLVTEEIQNVCTLAEFSKQNPDETRTVMQDLARQLDILVENHIHHVDLHPGNVLVDNEKNLFIIDFDKARTTPQNRHKLQKKYIRRWRRAVLKYKLPAVLNNIFNNRK
ncbi:MAG: phosphotransferase [Desulfobacteraceae bacterium]|nr:phosphotransferase [Desulfobacteraceae bacterium]MBC2754885.1 phosphotransferase [Desulfobacteraceae bacterium]